MTRSVTHAEAWSPRQRRLSSVLWWVGIVTLTAFVAAVMPVSWMRWTSERLGLDFGEQPLTNYLARHLSLLYGFVGCLMLWLSPRVDTCGWLIRRLAWCTVAFGLGQAWIDWQSGMPLWWTVGESVSTVAGGGLLLWMSSGKDFAEHPADDVTNDPAG